MILGFVGTSCLFSCLCNCRSSNTVQPPWWSLSSSLCCLLTPGLRKDIRHHIGPHPVSTLVHHQIRHQATRKKELSAWSLQMATLIFPRDCVGKYQLTCMLGEDRVMNPYIPECQNGPMQQMPGTCMFKTLHYTMSCAWSTRHPRSL